MTTLSAEQDSTEPVLATQFDDLEQQHETATLGMWIFLATEVMFFGGLIAAYAVYRALSPREFAWASRHLNVGLGCVNTIVLLASSLTMALAVRAAQLRRLREAVGFLLLTLILGAGFLGIKSIEYSQDFRDRLIPGWNFTIPEQELAEFTQLGLDPRRMELFFVLYFFMTGLHAIHLIIGIILVGVIAALVAQRRLPGGGATHVEVTGLYWHFIDIVWVFLYPLLYLIEVRR